MTNQPQNKWRALGLNILLLVTTVAVCFFVIEGALRVLHLESDDFTTLDACVGFKPKPNAEGWYVGPEWKTYVKMNSAGFRDVEHGEKKPGVTRILLLGDSITEGLHVPLEDTIGRKLEDDLTSQGKNVEVISLAQESYSTAQELLMYECYGEAYHPDIVVLDFYAGNDVEDNAFKNAPFTPQFTLVNGTLTLDEGYKTQIAARMHEYATIWPGVLFWIKDHSYFARFIYSRFLASAQNVEGREAPTPKALFLRDRSDTWKNAWDLTEALIDRLFFEVKQSGAKFVLTYIPSAEEQGDFGTLDSKTYDLSKPEADVATLAKQNKFGMIDLTPVFLDADEKGISFHWKTDLHWNATGHLLAAQALADYLAGEIKTNR